MAGPPTGTQVPRSPWPKAPHRSGWAEPEGHVGFVDHWKDCRIRNVDFPHFFPGLYRVHYF